MFRRMINDWFQDYTPDYNVFIKALLQDNKKAMNTYMNRVALATFSSIDTGRKPSEDAEPERFYRGFVLGLTVDLADRYEITSNKRVRKRFWLLRGDKITKMGKALKYMMPV